ncbi:ScbA/BarX family gamma-butyrolactone biosynthesis protein [Streptomyces sp. NPDC050658]|uniref:ScbA/BarX family gamma-butyrolactone biosynthesis protein n=1 Tax=unclassified Streptomyces TaxID=2593676 RepID=UPI00343B694F
MQHRTIDSSTLVRKSVSDEALVTGWHSLSENCQVVTARWPQHHPFYSEGERYSPLLATESLRQALALLTHTAHDIPLDHRLGWEYLRSTVNPDALWVDSEPAEVELVITHTDVKRRRMGSAHMTSQVQVTRSGLPLGTAMLRYSTHPPAIYDRLRGNYANAKDAFAQAIPLTPPVAATGVGRAHERDVVLSPTGRPHCWQLRVDTTHRVLFDHPHDHVPGMVLLEAASQAAQAEAAPEPVVLVALDTSFERYVEFDKPVLITAEPLPYDDRGDRRVEVQAHQAGQLVFAGSVTTRRRSHGAPGSITR